MQRTFIGQLSTMHQRLPIDAAALTASNKNVIGDAVKLRTWLQMHLVRLTMHDSTTQTRRTAITPGT